MSAWNPRDARLFFDSGGLYFPPSRTPQGGDLSETTFRRESETKELLARHGLAHSCAVKYGGRKQRVIIVPDHPEECSAWCAQLQRELEVDGTVSTLIADSKTVLQALDERRSAAEVAEILGHSPETTVIVGRTEGADCALYLLEQRPLGGAVLYDLKNRRNLLWSAIKRHAGPVGGNLMLVVGDPPNGSRFPEKYASKLGIERWVHSSKLASRSKTQR